MARNNFVEKRINALRRQLALVETENARQENYWMARERNLINYFNEQLMRLPPPPLQAPAVALNVPPQAPAAAINVPPQAPAAALNVLPQAPVAAINMPPLAPAAANIMPPQAPAAAINMPPQAPAAALDVPLQAPVAIDNFDKIIKKALLDPESGPKNGSLKKKKNVKCK
ncbi:formin-2-like [Microplitis mediator]|uniref:formin-2-like n=1 Tax=Microplitis mediator TaxID=375433 RepID=UPI002557544B|nr:formin-2-like [Microplitis mediator]